MNRTCAFALLLACAGPAFAQVSERATVRVSADVGKLEKASPIIEDVIARQKVAVYVQLTSISHVQPDGSLRREPIKFGTRQVVFVRGSNNTPIQIICLDPNIHGCDEPPYYSGGLLPTQKYSHVLPRFELSRLHVTTGSAIVIRTNFAALYPVNGKGNLQRFAADQDDWILLADLLKVADTQDKTPKQVPHRVVVRFGGHIFHYNYVLSVTDVPVR